MTDQKSEKISEIFNDLTQQKLIAPQRILELSTSEVRSFKASTLKSTNKIYYNSKMEGLDDDSVRFCLLHEEGHFINTQYAFYCFPLSIVVFVGAIFALKSLQIDLLLQLILGVFLIFIPILSYIISSRFDEFRSDEFAALLIKKHYPQKIPSEILKEALNFINAGVSSFLDFHPPPENRVKNIKDRFENK